MLSILSYLLPVSYPPSSKKKACKEGTKSTALLELNNNPHGTPNWSFLSIRERAGLV